MGIPEKDPLSQLSLPPGFRFFPTDEELLVQYLCRKVAGHHFSLPIIAEIDLYKFDPWVLPVATFFATAIKAAPMQFARLILGRKNGTFLVQGIENIRMVLDRTELLGRLDDWVLCRIYKKNSSSQKEVQTFSSKECSNGSSPSSSSHADDMLDMFLEINDQSFELPRVTSLRMQHQEEKFGFHNMGAGIFSDWVSPPDLESIPEFDSESQTQGMLNYSCNDFCVPSVPPFGHMDLSSTSKNPTDEEVQSGIRTHRVNEISSLYQHNPNGFLSNLGDPFQFRYSGH
ncbi:hypothetical protein TSUD_371610 [Trifolium subterraneum]|uniref:NAC domain-containing protein n=1 Tax=Trifolium subterraneum TaxID=3900 RepID=A0A2Z6PB20_TRISU|nr:hypothetical protein TSUD_371610 [Trifolium subterraneum]